MPLRLGKFERKPTKLESWNERDASILTFGEAVLSPMWVGRSLYTKMILKVQTSEQRRGTSLNRVPAGAHPASSVEKPIKIESANEREAATLKLRGMASNTTDKYLIKPGQ